MHSIPAGADNPSAMSADDARDILAEVGEQLVDLEEIELDQAFDEPEDAA